MASRLKNFAKSLPGRKAHHSLAYFGVRQDIAILAVLILAAAALALGLTLPALRVERPYLFNFFSRTDYLSIADVTAGLWADRAYALAGLTALLAGVIPFLTLAQAYRLWRRIAIFDKRFKGRLRRLRWLGLCSLAATLALAAAIAYLDRTGQADARTEPGLYLLATGIAAVTLVQILIGRAAARIHGRGIVEYPGY